MPYKDPETRRRYNLAYKVANKGRLRPIELARNRRRKQVLKAYIAKIRAESTCPQCGEDADCCFDFHHRNPAEKKFVVSSAPTRGVSLDTLKKEIVKCDILCANCHRKLHAGIV